MSDIHGDYHFNIEEQTKLKFLRQDIEVVGSENDDATLSKGDTH